MFLSREINWQANFKKFSCDDVEAGGHFDFAYTVKWPKACPDHADIAESTMILCNFNFWQTKFIIILQGYRIIVNM